MAGIRSLGSRWPASILSCRQVQYDPMNPSTLIGIVGSVLLLAAVLAFSAEDATLFVDLPSLGIVVLGTLAATFISYPLSEVLRIFRLIGTVLRNERKIGR